MNTKLKIYSGNFIFSFFLISILLMLFYQPFGYYSFLLSFLFLFCLILFCVYRISARKSEISISELINSSVTDISSLEDLYITGFEGRLIFRGNSCSLQCYKQNYRGKFNDFINSVIDNISYNSKKKGRVEQIINKSMKGRSVVHISLYHLRIQLILIIVTSYVISVNSLTLFFMRTLLVLCPIILLAFDQSGSWKIDKNSNFIYKSFFESSVIDLKGINNTVLHIPKNKLYFELVMSSDSSKYFIRDKMLLEISPIISAINSIHHGDIPKEIKQREEVTVLGEFKRRTVV